MFAIKFLRSFALLALFGASAASIARPNLAHAEVPALRRLAMVDMQRVLNETKEGQRARKELEESSKAKQTSLEKRQTALQGEVSKLSALSGQDRAAAEERLQREYMEVQSMAATLEQDLATEHNNLLQKMYEKSQAIVSDIASTDGLDLVLVRDPMTVIYAKESFDITNAVVEQYDRKHK